MCGIAGLLTRDRPVSPVDVRSVGHVMDKLAYRGPDGSGIWSSPHAVLGHRRLSIIDLTDAGAQPFVDEERGLAITYNGEIYNYREIRAHLASCGYAFRTETDTEVLLCAYHHYGAEFLSRLRGMFAFCLLDQKAGKAILARDAAGEKPLYYYFDDKQLVFSSEIKAFHAFPEIDLSIDAASVRSFFVLQYIPGPHTIYKAISRLPAGTALELDLSNWSVQLRRYWSPSAGPSSGSGGLEIETRLADSVRYRLIADVEVGILLSGGIDSTLLAWFARQVGAKPRAFSASFDSDELDEVDYARKVAESLGLEQVVVKGGQVTPDVFQDVIFHADEPLGDPACIPTYLLANELSKYVKVVLSGEGADELFWGYDTYRWERTWARLPGAARILRGSLIAQKLAREWEGQSAVPPGLTRALKVLSDPHDLGAGRWTTVFSDLAVDRLVPTPDTGSCDYLEEMVSQQSARLGGLAGLGGSLSGDLLYWLPDDLLMKVDRMTMAHGVEARAPYLDVEVIAAALGLPDDRKMNRHSGKLVLREIVERAFAGDLGRRLARRRKHGFEVPVGEWLKKPLREVVEDRLSISALKDSGLLDSESVRQLWHEFLRSDGRTPLRRKIWLVVCFQSWLGWHNARFGFDQRQL